ncbi:MAG: DUF3466 family protein, partial [Verrucomicrobia bacterium]|nr:DUF3466 family protein [Verrucomicrobiota bacterium]
GWVLNKAYGIDETGRVVGYGVNPEGAQHAFLWVDGTLTDLGTLGGALSIAKRVNDSGSVVGTSRIASGLHRAFLWQDGTMQDLGTFGGSQGDAFDINAHGQIVGAADTRDDYPHAFLWEDGVLRNLNELIPPDSGWVLNKAYGIDDSGRIVGYGVNPQGLERAFLLTPIPEPSVLALAAVGVAVLLRRASRRRRG